MVPTPLHTAPALTKRPVFSRKTRDSCACRIGCPWPRHGQPMRHAHESRVLRENTGRSVRSGAVRSGGGTLFGARGGVPPVVPSQINTYYQTPLFLTLCPRASRFPPI